MSFSTHEIPWTFKTWIKNFESVDLPIGDLARDILSDEAFPDSEDYSVLYDHLLSTRASREALEALKTTWDFYLATR